jgi:hypothetical protein
MRVVRHAAPRERDDLVGRERRARERLHRGVDALPPVVVGHAEDRDVVDGRVTVEHVLDLGG